MKKAILIERITKTLYLKDGLVLSLETAEEKLQHNIFGETKTMVEETEIDAFFYKNKKDVDLMFWNYMNEKKLNADNYYLIYLKLNKKLYHIKFKSASEKKRHFYYGDLTILCNLNIKI